MKYSVSAQRFFAMMLLIFGAAALHVPHSLPPNLPLQLSLRVPHSPPRNSPASLCASEDAAKKRLTANAAPPPTAPCGCCPPEPPDITSASATLAAYDEGHRRTAAQPGRGQDEQSNTKTCFGRVGKRHGNTTHGDDSEDEDGDDEEFKRE